MARKLRLEGLFCISSIAGVLAIARYCVLAHVASFGDLWTAGSAMPLVVGGLCFANALHIWKQIAWAKQPGVRSGAARLRGS